MQLYLKSYHLLYSLATQIKYGRIFARYLADPSNVFVISSDFCHWGQRFRYQHYDEKCGDIWESIKVTYFIINLLMADYSRG